MAFWLTEEEVLLFHCEVDNIKSLQPFERLRYQVTFLQSGRDRGPDNHIQRGRNLVNDQLRAPKRKPSDRYKDVKPKRDKGRRDSGWRIDGEVLSTKSSFKKPEGW